MLISRVWVWVDDIFTTWRGQFISHISIPMRRPPQMIQIVSKNLILKASCAQKSCAAAPTLQILHFHTIRPCWYNIVWQGCYIVRSNTSRQDGTRKRILHRYTALLVLPVSFLCCLWYETLFRDQGWEFPSFVPCSAASATSHHLQDLLRCRI